MSTQDVAFWGWAIRGLGGVVNMLDREADAGTQCSDGWVEELRGLIQRLQTVLDKLERERR